MAKIKAILIDIDGTLVRSDRTISPLTLDKINQAREQGVIVSLCTGRAVASLKTIFDWINWQGLHITSGGAQVYDADKKETVWSEQISHEDGKWLYDQIKNLGGDVVIQRPEALYGYQAFLDRILEHPWEMVTESVEKLDDFSCYLISIHQVNPQIEQFFSQQTRLKAVRMVAASGIIYYDVTAQRVSKLTAIKKWAEQHELQLKEIAGMGDGENDLEFLSSIGMPMVMENSTPILLEKFDFALPSNNDDGVAVGIDRVLNNNSASLF